MIRILDEIRSRMINSVELFRALRLIVIKQDVTSASLEELKETGGPTAEESFRRKNTRRQSELIRRFAMYSNGIKLEVV